MPEAGKRGGPGVRVNVNAIRAAREAKGWSQNALARKIGCSARVIERVEARGTAALTTLKEMAEALGVTTESLRPPVSPPTGFSRGLHQLPPSLPDFTGREDELVRILARLRRAGGAVGVSSALRGMGGIGKTVTAIEACWELKEDFPDAQLVLELRGMSPRPLTPVEAMTQVIHDFHPETGKLPPEEAELLPLYRRTLMGKRAIILLDDARDEEHVRCLLSVAPPVAFVITSRHALGLSKQGVEAITLGMLSLNEALELLRGIVGKKGEDDQLRTIAELCGRLPLALRVAGDFLQTSKDWTLADYIRALETERLRWLKIGTGADQDVEASLRLSSALLVQENLDLAEKWQMLHIFPGSFDLPAVTEIWEMKADDLAVRDNLSTLTSRSLLMYDDSAGRYQLHDLMRPIAANLFGESNQ